MTRRSIIWPIGMVLILVGAGYGWHAWMGWRTITPPPVAALKPAVPDLDAPGELNVEYGAPKETDTLEDVARDADVVLVVRLVTDRTEQKEPGSQPATMRYTIYTFHILEIIKGALHAGQNISVARFGGRLNFEDVFPRPGLGETFVMFLKWSPTVDAYENIHGPETTFRVVRGTMQPMGWHFRRQQGRKVEDVARQLRRIVPRR